MTTGPKTDDSYPIDHRLRGVLRHLPAPVGIVTSFDPDSDEPVGLVMSAIMPVSLEPCAMAIAINRSGSAHAAVLRSGQFCINLLDSERHQHLAPFVKAEERDLRFTQSDWARRGSVWYIEGAPANIFCDIRASHPFGTHDLLIGEVYDLLTTGSEDILGWANGSLGRLEPLPLD